MIRYSAPYSPSTIGRGDVFAARQFPRQAFGNLIDPVLNIDWFEMSGPTFPAHPHAGFSAVTYVFADSPNGFDNRDSLGKPHVIRPGGLHWSRASKGMMHEEIPQAGGGTARGLQIFLNLPEAHQADDAAAFPLRPEDVVTGNGAGWTRRTAVDGTAIGDASDALPAPVQIAEVLIEARAAYPLNVPAGWGGILIALESDVALGEGINVAAGQAIGLAADTPESLQVTAPAGPARVAIVIGRQLNQPVYAYGPLMMASPQTLERARAYVATLTMSELQPND